MTISCPLCAYRPHAGDRWACDPGCYTIWNTFDTRGRCPGCAKQWRETNCPACALWSLHEDWYHDDAEAADETGAERVEERELVEVGGGSGGGGGGGGGSGPGGG
jgi:hypothetical protein